MNTRIINPHSAAPYRFTFRPVGAFIEGHQVMAYGWDLKDAIRTTRKVVHKAFRLRLISKKREGWQ